MTGAVNFPPEKGGCFVNNELNGSPVNGWPVSFADGNPATDSRVFGSPPLADITGTGKLETIVGGLDGYVRFIRWDGTILRSKVPSVAVGIEPKHSAHFSSPAIGDVDGVSSIEFVIGEERVDPIGHGCNHRKCRTGLPNLHRCPPDPNTPFHLEYSIAWGS